MILAEDELAIGTEHAGIMVLDDALRRGHAAGRRAADRHRRARARDHAEPARLPRRLRRRARGPRRDRGAARAAAVERATRIRRATAIAGFAVEVESPDLCPRFTARLFEDVTIGPSPPWLKARLMAAGQRPINNVVDITNYVMLLTGQPLHAFDPDRVAGGRLVVRRARDGRADDDARRRRAHARPRRLRHRRRRRPDVDRRASWAARAPRSREDTTRVLMEAATWNGPNIQRTSTRLGLRTEASGRFEKELAPEQGLEGAGRRDAADGRAVRRAPGRRDDRRRRARARRRVTLRLRDARVERLLGAPVPRARRSARSCERSASASPRPTDGLDVTVPHWRRGDVTREADLIEEVARLWGLDHLPATLPSRRGAVGRLTPAQRLRRRAEDALVGAGLSEAVGWSFTAPDVADRLGLPRTTRRASSLENPMCEDQSVLRTTLLGSLLDAAAPQHVARLRRRRACSSPARSTCRERDGAAADAGDTATPGTRRAIRSCRSSARARRAADRAGAAAELGRRRSRRAPTSSPPRACSRRCCDALRVDWSASSRRRGPFLHPGRGADGARRATTRRRAGSARCTRSVAAAVGPRRRRRLRARPRRCSRPPRPPCRATRTSRRSRRCARTSRSSSPTTSRPARVLDVIRAAGGALLLGAEVFDVYRGAQVGEGRASLALALEFRAADRTLTDEEVAPAARADRRRAARPARRRAAWLAVAVLGASGYAGALAARSCTATRTSSSRTSPRAPTPARGSTTSTRATACRWCSRSSTSTRHGRRRRGDRRLPARRRRARRRRAARARRARRRPLRRLPPARPRRSTSDWYGEHGARSCSARASTACPSCTASAIAGADLVANPGCYPTAALLGARAARAGGLDRRRRHRRQVRRLRRRARADRDARTSSPSTRTSRPTGRAPPPHAGDRPGARGACGAPRHGRRSRRTWCRSTRASSSPATSRRRASTTPARAARALRRRRTRASRSSSCATGRPACATCARRTSAASSVHVDARTGRVLVFAAIDNLWKGAASQAVQNLNLMFGRTRREGLRADATSSPRAGSTPPGAACPSAPARRPAPRGFRAAGVARRAQAVRRARRRAARLRRARRRQRGALHRAPACSPRRCCCAASARRLDALRAVVANSGNANAATGTAGSRTPRAMQGAAAMAAGVREDQVAVASTGVIGVPSSTAGDDRAGPRARRGELRRDGDRRLRRAIRTTDAFAKRASLDVAAAVGHGAPQRPGQGRGHDPAGLRDDAVLRADRRRAGAPRPPTCCSASA